MDFQENLRKNWCQIVTTRQPDHFWPCCVPHGDLGCGKMKVNNWSGKNVSFGTGMKHELFVLNSQHYESYHLHGIIIVNIVGCKEQIQISADLDVPDALFTYTAEGNGIPCVIFTGSENVCL